MIAMQYSFVLPADYDMAIVRERIATKGPLLDNLPGLIFKAYLHAERGTAMENTYAPFYLWQDEEAMHGFLNGAGFASVSQAFGWPSVRTWTPWHASVGPDVRQARQATRSVASIAAYSDLAQLREHEESYARRALENGALAVVIGFEPVTWTITRLCLWRDGPPATLPPLPPLPSPQQEQVYQVGHISAPALQ
jgi:heme-degrading monooxygenase HmoA